MKKTLFAVGVLAGLSLVSTAGAQTVNFANGNPGDWTDSGSGNPVNPTTVNTGGPSGAGYTALPNNYTSAWVDNGPYTFFGSPGLNTSPNQLVTQSVAIYLNPTLTSEQSGQIMLDMTPGGAGSDAQLFGAEDGIFVTGTGSGITATTYGGAQIGDITSAGWYDFQLTWTRGASGTDPVNVTLSLDDLTTATALGSTTEVGPNSGNPTDLAGWQSQDLGGTGYAWITYWTPGFADDTLDVADVDASTASAPDSASTAMLLGVTLSALGLARRKLSC